MGWSSYIYTDRSVKYSCCGATAGTGTGCCTGCRFFSDTSGNAGSGAFDACTTAEPFHDGAAVNGRAAAHV
jgi:hypothetical protein